LLNSVRNRDPDTRSARSPERPDRAARHSRDSGVNRKVLAQIAPDGSLDDALSRIAAPSRGHASAPEGPATVILREAPLRSAAARCTARKLETAAIRRRERNH